MERGTELVIESLPGGRYRLRSKRVGFIRGAFVGAFLLSVYSNAGCATHRAESHVAVAEESAPVAQAAPADGMAFDEAAPTSLSRAAASSAAGMAPSGAPAAPPGAPQAAKTEAAQTTQSTDGSRKPGTLLVYEADCTLAVYQVDKALDAVEALAKRVGGHLVERTEQRIVVRVPRERFEEALSGVDAVGDVMQRNVRSEDVTDHYRDLEVRLRNARAVRGRLEELLAKAQTVEESLKIEQQLARVTQEIELLTATLQGLSDRVAYSKITVSFRPRATENVPDEVLRLPFPWLESLGLFPLFNLHE